jgi:hypothetical protein
MLQIAVSLLEASYRIVIFVFFLQTSGLYYKHITIFI